MRAVMAGKDGTALTRPWFDDRLVRVRMPCGSVGTGVALDNGDVSVFGAWLVTLGKDEAEVLRDDPHHHKRAWLLAYYAQSVRYAQMDVDDAQQKLDAWSGAMADAQKEAV